MHRCSSVETSRTLIPSPFSPHASGLTRICANLLLVQAALLRDAVARINYEETGKKKALNFPDEEPSREIMARARVELEKARVKAAEARAKPKAQPAVKPEVSAATLDEAQAAVALTTFSQPSHVVSVCFVLPCGSPRCCMLHSQPGTCCTNSGISTPGVFRVPCHRSQTLLATVGAK